MTPITPDELVSLNRTMTGLYEAAGHLVEVEKDRDHLAGILEKVARAFDQPSVVALIDFAELPKIIEALVRENAEVKDAHHALWKRLQLVEGENETLARNMPPEPPSDTPVVLTYDPACFQTTKVIGQAWCRGNPSEGHIGVAYPGGRLVLCEVHKDTTTGALTYHPVAAKDLPLVQ